LLELLRHHQLQKQLLARKAQSEYPALLVALAGNKYNMIECKNITKIYTSGDVETIALAGVSFKNRRWRVCSNCWSSGSGKSTLMHIIGALIHQRVENIFWMKKMFLNFPKMN